MFVPRAAADVLQERQGQDGDVRHAGAGPNDNDNNNYDNNNDNDNNVINAGAGQLPQQGVRPRGQRVPAGARHHAQVGGYRIYQFIFMEGT